MSRVQGSLLAVLLLAACAPPSADGSRPVGARREDGDGAQDDGSADGAGDAGGGAIVSPPIDAGAGGRATTYFGTLDRTPTVRFGGQGAGGSFCNYDVTLEDVAIEVTALPDGQVIAATVRDTMVEASVPPCTFPPAPTSDQSFAFTAMTTTDAGIAQLTFKGAAGNRPATSLVVELTKVGASYEAAATWHRTDQIDPLDWTVKTKITLGPR